MTIAESYFNKLNSFESQKSLFDAIKKIGIVDYIPHRKLTVVTFQDSSEMAFISRNESDKLIQNTRISNDTHYSN